MLPNNLKEIDIVSYALAAGIKNLRTARAMIIHCKVRCECGLPLHNDVVYIKDPKRKGKHLPTWYCYVCMEYRFFPNSESIKLKKYTYKLVVET